MAGAEGVGDLVARAEASVTAGCDMVLACNDFAGADDLLARWRRAPDDDFARRAAAMEGHDPASNAQARP
jgi:beta-N-acetylhexosaminidase